MIQMIIFTTIVCFGVVWCYIKWTYRHVNRLATKFKSPPSYPIFGSLHLFMSTKQSEMAFKMLTDYGSEPLNVWFGPLLVIFISKPEDIQIVLNNSKALKKAWFYKYGGKLIGEGLVTSSTDKWRIHRRIINPVFKRKNLIHYFQTFNENIDILIKNLKNEVGKTLPFDLLDYIFPMTLDTICQTTMGYNLKFQSNDESEFGSAFLKSLELLSKRVFYPWLNVPMVNSIYERITGTYKVFETVQQLPTKVIKDKKESFYAQNRLANELKDVNNQEKNEPNVLLDILLKLTDSGTNFSDKDLKDEVITTMTAGSETAAQTICFCILLLAMHPKIQEKVYNEIYEIVGVSNEPLTLENINKLKYLEQVIMETLRLFPIVPAIARELENDIKIFSGDCVVPKETTVLINIYGTHRNPEFYINPFDFNPENFSTENIIKRHKYSYLPFSGGARGCIGHKYAMMIVKLTIIKFLKNFSVHTKMSDIPIDYSIIIKSVNGFPVIIHSREK